MLGLAIVCDDYLCVALEQYAMNTVIREDVAGATLMALSSAAPGYSKHCGHCKAGPLTTTRY